MARTTLSPVILTVYREPFGISGKHTYEYVYTADCKPGMRIAWEGEPSPLVTITDWRVFRKDLEPYKV